MKRQKTKKVNGLLIFSICLLILAIATPITLSFFTAQKGGTKEITFGKIELESGVTQVSSAVDTIPGGNMLQHSVVLAKDIFSEDVIVRASFSFAHPTEIDNENTENTIHHGIAYKGIGTNGLEPVYVDEMLNGEKNILQTTHSGLYIIDYTVGNEAKVGYSNDAGYAGSNGSNVFSVLADITNPSSGYISGVTGTARVVNPFVSVTVAVSKTGRVYNQTYNATDEEYTLTYVRTLDSTEEDGYEVGYRWVVIGDYYYLADWEYNGTDASLTITQENSTSLHFKNITKPSILRNQYVTVSNGVITAAQEDTPGRLDLYTEADRDALETALFGAKNNPENGTLNQLKAAVATSYTAMEQVKANLVASSDPAEIASLQSSYSSYVTAYNTAVAAYYAEMELSAKKLDDAQKLFMFLSEDNKVPTYLPSLQNNAQFSTDGFTIDIEFNAIQSAYLVANGYNAVGNSAGSIAQLLASGENTTPIVW